MAHLKKFGLAQKLSKLRDNGRKLYEFVLFGSGQEDDLYYSAEKITNLSLQNRNTLLDLEFSMQNYQFAYMALNQVAISQRVFVMQQCHQWNQIEKQGQSTILLNPEIVQISKETSIEWEVNQCFPFLKAQIERYNKIKINYDDLDYDEQSIELEGFQARVAQQAIDSLNGYQIIDPRINLGRWDVNDKWTNALPKVKLTLDHYKIEIQKLVETHPEVFQMKNLKQLNTKFKENDEEFSFESILMRRLERYIKREMLEPLKVQMETDDTLFDELRIQK